jgi:hypothetical protein
MSLRAERGNRMLYKTAAIVSHRLKSINLIVSALNENKTEHHNHCCDKNEKHNRP